MIRGNNELFLWNVFVIINEILFVDLEFVVLLIIEFIVIF